MWFRVTAAPLSGLHFVFEQHVEGMEGEIYGLHVFKLFGYG
jgi:hypothetical protein